VWVEIKSERKMKTTLITTALLAVLFAGCSKDDDSKALEPASSTNASISRPPRTLVGTYTVVSYRVDGTDYTDEYKGFRLYLYKDGDMAETVLGDQHSKGNYKFDGATLSFNFLGNYQTNNLTTHPWGVTFLENRQMKLFDDEGSRSMVLYLNFPSDANPL
jgi:hypothetical protein